MSLVTSKKLSFSTVVLLGQQPLILTYSQAEVRLHKDGHTYARKAARDLGAQPDRIYLLQAAPGHSSPGYQRIVNTEQTGEHWTAADGIILEQTNSAAFFQTADCPSVIMCNKRTGIVGLVHCGRPAGEPVDGRNIITKLLDLIATNDQDIDQLEVYITGAIAGIDFKHDDNDSIRAKALPYLDEFGADVFADVDTLALDMVKVITWQLMAAGLDETQITHDGLNTYRGPGLASHRRSANEQELRVTANTVLVVT